MGLFKKTILPSSNRYENTVINVVNYWAISSRDNYMVKISDNLIETSSDGGLNYDNSIVFNDANKIINGYLHSNGNISLFTIDNKIYKTSINLSSITEVVLYEEDRVTPYVFHTPSNANFTGAYYTTEDEMSYNNSGIYALANYCNSIAINGGRGASAVITPITDDFGDSFVVSYEFGQNVVYRDNGTALGGSTGTLLGDASNANVCRHVHSIEYNKFNNKYYMNTGDRNDTSAVPDMDEIGWYEGVYNSNTRTIDWVRIDFGTPIEREDNLKATGMYFTPTHIYWGSDANPVVVPDNQGIFRSPINTFSDKNTHEQVYALDTNDVILNMKVDENTGIVLAVLLDEGSGEINRLLAVKNYGNGDGQIYTVPNNPTLLKLNSPNEDGFFRMDFNGFDTLQTKTLFIKVGEDLFNNL
jgi:hypothetical protein